MGCSEVNEWSLWMISNEYRIGFESEYRIGFEFECMYHLENVRNTENAKSLNKFE